MRQSNAAFSAADGCATNWDPNANGEASVLIPLGSIVYLSGGFTQINGGVSRKSIATVDAISGAVLPWNPGTNGGVYSMHLSGNKLYVGGFFTAINPAGFTSCSTTDTPRMNIAAVNLTDGCAITFNASANNTVKAISGTDSTLYIVGDFTQLNGIARGTVGAILTDGTLLNWDPKVAPAGSSTIVTDGTNVYLGGTFRSIQSVPRAYLAAVTTAGELIDWAPTADARVQTLATSGSTVFIGGFFSQINGINRNYIAAVDETGTLLSWNPGMSNGGVKSIIVNGTMIYAGGLFSQVSNRVAYRFATIGVDGRLY